MASRYMTQALHVSGSNYFIFWEVFWLYTSPNLRQKKKKQNLYHIFDARECYLTQIFLSAFKDRRNFDREDQEQLLGKRRYVDNTAGLDCTYLIYKL